MRRSALNFNRSSTEDTKHIVLLGQLEGKARSKACYWQPQILWRTAAEHAHPADRFAREMLAILERNIARLRRLMRNPFGGLLLHPCHTQRCYGTLEWR